MIDIETIILSISLLALLALYLSLSVRFNRLKDRDKLREKQFLEMLEFQGQNARDIRELKGLK